MRLSRLIASVKDLALRGEDVDISGMTADSRKIEKGFLFVAIPGTQHDGRAFIADAVARGAAAVMIPEDSSGGAPPSLALPARGRESALPRDQSGSSPLAGEVREGGAPSDEDFPVSAITAPDMRKAISAIAAAFWPRQPETIAAVTGTSGKTSTAQFARELWQALGETSASIGTLGLITGDESRYGSLTTPDAITLHQLLDECAGRGITHLAMEASSHGLDMHRLDHVRLKAAGFTNFSRDHLDYHATMDHYFAAKLRLFKDILPRDAAAVLNADIPEFNVLSAAAKAGGHKMISYGAQGKDLRLLDTRFEAEGQTVRAEIFGATREIRLPVIGGFQAWNALCALGLAVGCGAGTDKAVAALEKVTGVPGRLQLAGVSRAGGAVYVDYAHKPDALENVLKALRHHIAAHKGAELGVVFGCGGNRDKGKRPVMGDIAQRYADWSIVTDDNPRKEDPATIRKEILAGYTASGPSPAEIGDRAEAIAAGIARLKPHDILVIAGKGHEPGQTVGDTVLPFDDTEVARKALDA